MKRKTDMTPEEKKQRARERFVDDGESIMLTPCVTCKHKYKGSATCVAFPDGIPDDILFGHFAHKTEYPGDNGIVYEPREQ